MLEIKLVLIFACCRCSKIMDMKGGFMWRHLSLYSLTLSVTRAISRKLRWVGSIYLPKFFILIGWDCRIHRLHFCRGVDPSLNEYRGYDIKQSDGEAPVMKKKLRGMQSTPSLPLLSGPLRLEVVASERVK